MEVSGNVGCFLTLGTLGNDDDDGTETLSRLLERAESVVKCRGFFWRLNSKTFIRLKLRDENSSSYVYVLHKTSH